MDSRLVLGVSISADAGEIDAALVGVGGIGLDSRIHCIATSSAPTFRVAGATTGSAASPHATSAVAGHLDPAVITDQIMDAVSAVSERSAISLDQLLFISLISTDFQAHPYAELVANRLAEQSGLTVVVGFASRDWAAGGQGRPIGPIVDWMLANDQRFSRIIVHVDDSTRITILPAAAGPSRVRSFEAGPGMGLLDAMVAAFSQGRQSVDSRGMLAVQGRQIKPLVRRWATHPFLRQPPPKSLSPLDFAVRFIDETLQLAIERGWSVADVLCTATHFVAACPADFVRQFVLKEQSVEQVAVVGRGTHNGFLLRLLEEQFTDVGIATIALPGIARDAYEAMTGAVLGCLALDGVPANLPGVTGARGPRLLGQLIPGSFRSWQACIDWMQRAQKIVAPRAA
jgi:anhydro-N-acetylmuramic acid kinase